MSDEVSIPIEAYMQMSKRWKLLDTLLGGTQAMRDASTEFLPQEPKEIDKNYRNRLNRSVLYGAFRDTVEKLVSKPYSRPITIQGELSPPLNLIAEDVDLSGRDITQFGREVFRTGVIYGLTHVLVDFPSRSPSTSSFQSVAASRSLRDDRLFGVRPVFLHVPPKQIIGWRVAPRAGGGGMKLTRVRIKETRTEADGDWGEKTVDYIRVISEVDWQIWKRAGSDRDYVLEDEGTHSFGSVPLFTYYLDRTGDLTANPPLEDLAWLNLAHWQSMSDQRNILRFARVGLLFGKGFSEEELEDGLVVGPTQVISTQSSDASLEYVEYSGTGAIKNGAEDLRDLEERMEVLGLQPLIGRSGGTTATEKVLSESRTHSSVQSWVRTEEDFIFQLYLAAAKWIGKEISEDFQIDINNDFGIQLRSDKDIELLDKLNARGKISDETLLKELKRRGFLSETIDVEEEMERTEEAQLPPLIPPTIPPSGDEGEAA